MEEYVFTNKYGITKTLDQWSKESGISKHTILYRINTGASIDDAISKDYISPKRKTPIDLTGRIFGKLTVLGVSCVQSTKSSERTWVCRCNCENHTIVEVIQHNLLNGHCNNCGCSNKNAPKDMIIGEKYGNLEIVECITDKSMVPKSMRHSGVLWRCRCDCGNEIILPGGSIRARGDNACCDECKNALAAYGLSNSKIYIAYRNMIRRCTDPKDPAYGDYGGRGITVCDEWKKHINARKQNEGFLRFYNWAIIHDGEVKGLTLDREDNEKGYSPDNCRFVSMKAQCNNHRGNRIIEYNGESKTSTELAEEYNINPYTLRCRLNSGLSVEEALNNPIRENKNLVSISTGETHTITEWSILSGINRSTITGRINRNWDPNIAFTKGATNSEIYNHVPYGVMADGTYTDILGNHYTQAEWEAHQAVFFD